MMTLNLNEDIEELIKNQNIKEAESELKKLKQNKICDDKYFFMEALLIINQKEYKKAIKSCQIALQYNINNSKVYFLLGVIAERQEKYNLAYIYYEEAEYLSKKDNQKFSNLEYLCKNYDIEKIDIKPLSIILIAKDNLEYTKVALESIKRYNNKDTYEIIVVDYNSSDETKSFLEKQDNIKFVSLNEERGLLSAYNEGLLKIRLDNDVLILKNDTIIMPNSILNLRLALYEEKDTGAVAPISNKGDKNQLSNVICSDFNEYISFCTKSNIYNTEVHKRTQSFSNFALLIKGEVLLKVGLLNEKFITEEKDENNFKFKIPMAEYGMLICNDSFVYRISD